MIGFEDQNIAICFDSLVAALDEHQAAILGPVLQLTRPASHSVEKRHEVGWVYRVDRAKQLMTQLTERLSPCEAIKLLSSPVPFDNPFLGVPDKNRLEGQLNQIRLAAQGLRNLLAR